MPLACFKSVYAVSSEDPSHNGSNLLKAQSGKKWKTKEIGEKSAYIILQLDKPQQITGIDIGNEQSAFIMVSVGKLACDKDEFKEILITSSFMTPIESKNSTNINRVRCFAANALVESVAKEKWELVKVTCTQPFNRHVQYGLSFITLHVAGDKTSDDEANRSKNVADKVDSSQLGPLQLREDSPDSESESSSSLFSRWKQSRTNPLSAAAAIRAASSPLALKTNSNSLKPSRVEISNAASKPTVHSPPKDGTPKVRDRNRNDLFYDEEDDAPNERLEKKMSADRKRSDKEKSSSGQDKRKHESQTKSESGSERNSRKDAPSSSSKSRKVDSEHHRNPRETSNEGDDRGVKSNKRHESEAGTSRKRPSSSPSSQSHIPPKRVKNEKPIQYKPFKNLMGDVVLVISGIQNPDRGVIRQKAIEMGARYKPDWTDGCTHLICAFKNTPKYNQVRGKGKIITRQWIEKCHSLKKRLPWRRFALDDREAEKPESEDEIFDLSLRPPDTSEPDTKPLSPSSTGKSQQEDPAPVEDSSEDVLVLYDNGNNQSYLVSSGSDTDEELEKIARTKNNGDNEPTSEHVAKAASEDSPPDKKAKKKKFIVFEASTEEDESIKVPKQHPESPKLFEGMKFYLSSRLPTAGFSKTKKCIEQFHGQLIHTLSDADYVISTDKIGIDAEFKGEVVSPLWVLECSDMECRVPTRRYLV